MCFSPGCETHSGVQTGYASGVFRGLCVRFVWRNKNGDDEWEEGIHDFELRWRVLHHPSDGWSEIELSGSSPTSLASAEADCNAEDNPEESNDGNGDRGGNGDGND